MLLIAKRSEEAARRLVDHPDMIAVKPMREDDTLALLEKKLGLAVALEHMPLAITQAGAQVYERCIDVVGSQDRRIGGKCRAGKRAARLPR
jgi:hypothetical protein